MPPKKKQRQAVIQSDEFDGEENLSAEEWANMTVTELAGNANKFVRPWNQGLVGLLGITLNVDNNKPMNLNIFLQGDLCGGSRKSLLAKRFWASADNTIQLYIPSLESALFKFDNRLTSDLIDSSRFDHSFNRNGATLTPEEMDEAGVGGFCLKVHLIPSQAKWISFTVSLFPGSLADLVDDHPLCRNPVFPGIRIMSGELPLHPRADQLFPERATGCPIIPMVLPGSATETTPVNLSSRDVQAAVAALMRKALKPDSRNLQTLLSKWQSLLSEGASLLADGSPDNLWPLPAEPEISGRT